MENFVYIVFDQKSKKAALIDSGWETNPIKNKINESKLELLYAIATHEHFDHISSIHDIASELKASVVAHKDSGLKADIFVEDGQRLELGYSSLQVIHTPGHTPGSICIYDGSHLFTGDTLFIGTCGRTDLAGGSDELLFQSLQRLMQLPDSTIIYSGHDYGPVPYRTMKEEKELNPVLKAKTLSEFRGIP
jgi:glyoxylase-like metal-dependent hydrolase (beta-lactamase superfamily II)